MGLGWSKQYNMRLRAYSGEWLSNSIYNKMLNESEYFWTFFILGSECVASLNSLSHSTENSIMTHNYITSNLHLLLFACYYHEKKRFCFVRGVKSRSAGLLRRQLHTESFPQPVMLGATVLSCGKWCHMGNGPTGRCPIKMWVTWAIFITKF